MNNLYTNGRVSLHLRRKYQCTFDNYLLKDDTSKVTILRLLKIQSMITKCYPFDNKYN